MGLTTRITPAALIAAFVAVALMSTPVPAQSLAELAKQESARRKAITSPSKVITNENLSPAPPPAPAADTAAAPASPEAPAAAVPAEPAADQSPAAPPKDENYWRQRISNARATLARSQIVQDALQSRINALATDFVNRDDPAQRAVIGTERQKALAEMDRVKQEIATSQQTITDTQEEARKAGVPAGWVR